MNRKTAVKGMATGWDPRSDLLGRLLGPALGHLSPTSRYSMAIAIMALAVTMRALLDPVLGTSTPLLPLVPAALVCACLVGFAPALTATLIGPVLMICWLACKGEIEHFTPWALHVALFILSSTFMAALIHIAQRAYRDQGQALSAAKQSEQRALIRESQLHLIADAVPVLIAYVDHEHRYRFTNRQYEEWFGYRADELAGAHARDVLGDEAYERVRPRMVEALRGNTVEFEAQVPYSRGGTRFVMAHYVPDTGPDGQVRGYVALIQDLTQRKRAEVQLTDAKERLTLALRAGRAGTFEWDIQTDVTLWSDELLDLYGFRRGEFIETHQGWLACVHPDDRERIAASAQTALSRGFNQVDFRIRRHDTGETRWLQARSKVMYDSEGRPVRMLGVNVDITEHKQASEALRDSERNLQLIYNSASDALCLLHAESAQSYRVVSANEAFLRLTGLSRERVDGQAVDNVWPESSYDLFCAKASEAIASAQNTFFQVHFDSPDGRRIGETTLIPIAGRDGGPTQLLGTIKDVTAGVQAELALRLEAQRKDEFLAMLAHELRNPLAPIRNIAHMLTRGEPKTAMTAEFGAILQRQTDQLTRMVDDLLDVSRITRGAINLRKELLTLDRVLRGAVENLEPTLRTKQQVLSVQWLAQGHHVIGDETRLTQVFSNLLSNASKYSPSGTTIEIIVKEDDSSTVICVRDSGVGIDPQMLTQIFDLFVQGDRSLDRRDSGLGIGLTIVRSLVDLHDGSVEARSAGLGSGSEFVVRLPLAHPMPAAQIVAPVLNAEAAPASRRVLIVDDNVIAADTLELIFQQEGYTTRVVRDGESVLPVVEAFSPGLVLLDIGLPGVDGYVVAQSIRSRYPQRPVRIFAVTGYGSPEDRALALSCGFDAHFTKPVHPNVLLSAAANILGTAATDGAVETEAAP